VKIENAPADQKPLITRALASVLVYTPTSCSVMDGADKTEHSHLSTLPSFALPESIGFDYLVIKKMLAAINYHITCEWSCQALFRTSYERTHVDLVSRTILVPATQPPDGAPIRLPLGGTATLNPTNLSMPICVPRLCLYTFYLCLFVYRFVIVESLLVLRFCWPINLREVITDHGAKRAAVIYISGDNHRQVTSDHFVPGWACKTSNIKPLAKVAEHPVKIKQTLYGTEIEFDVNLPELCYDWDPMPKNLAAPGWIELTRPALKPKIDDLKTVMAKFGFQGLQSVAVIETAAASSKTNGKSKGASVNNQHLLK
jgi:hypothetical protein